MNYVIGKCVHGINMAGMPIPKLEEMGWSESAVEAMDFGSSCVEWLENGLTLVIDNSSNIELKMCQQCKDNK